MAELGGAVETAAAPATASDERASAAPTSNAPRDDAPRDEFGRRVRGRGAVSQSSTVLVGEGAAASRYESFGSKNSGRGPAQSAQGWVVIVTGVHEEATEDDLQDRFGEYGRIRNVHLNLDRRTGFVKGYALIVYSSQQEAQGAIDEMDGVRFMGQQVTVDFAFSSGPMRGGARSHRRPREGDRD